jgi:ribosomal protein S4
MWIEDNKFNVFLLIFMVCLVKRRNKFYKQVLLDVWGYHKLYKKISKLIHFMKIIRDHRRERNLLFRREFVFNFKRRIWFRFKKRFKYKYIAHRFLYNFFLIVRRRNYIKYRVIARKKKGYFFKNYIVFLEGRLFMLIYRSNFVNNIFKLKFIIDRGIFLVNGEKKYYSNYIVKVGELVQVDFKYKKYLIADMLMRFNFKNILWNHARYLFVNYKFFFIFFLRAPKIAELKYPIKLDVYKGGDIYFL